MRPFTPQLLLAGTQCTYQRRDGQAELFQVAGYIQRRFTRPQTVTHDGGTLFRSRDAELVGLGLVYPTVLDVSHIQYSAVH